MIYERCPFLPCCWAPEAPTWHVGCAELGIPSAEPAVDGARAVTRLLSQGRVLVLQLHQGVSRLERQPHPAQKVCESPGVAFPEQLDSHIF